MNTNITLRMVFNNAAGRVVVMSYPVKDTTATAGEVRGLMDKLVENKGAFHVDVRPDAVIGAEFITRTAAKVV